MSPAPLTDHDLQLLGPRIYRLRIERDLSQMALAIRLGVSVSSVARWERGDTVPRSDHLNALYLLIIEDDMARLEVDVKPSNSPTNTKTSSGGTIAATSVTASTAGRLTAERVKRLSESVHGTWFCIAALDDELRRSGQAALDDNDRRVGDALARMAGEVSSTDEPPREVLRSIGRWFAHKADLFASSVVVSAGGAVGIKVAQHLPHLLEVAKQLADLQ